MTREDFQTMWKMLIGIWPRLDTDESIAAWWGLLGHYPAHHATSAVRQWATDRRSAPTPHDIIAGIKVILNQHQRDGHSLNRGNCDECENTGFIWKSFEGQGTVARCHRGCKPPVDTAYRVDATTERANASLMKQRFDAIVASRANKRRQLGETAYLESQGYDPRHFRISHGMIIARPKNGIH